MKYDESDLIPVHMSNREMDVLDVIQGKKHFHYNGERSYAPLYYGMLQSGPIKDVFLAEAARHRHASGGIVASNMQNLAALGRNGDNGIAYVPRGLAEIFHQANGFRSEHPITGYPEFYALHDKLQPLINMLRNSYNRFSNFAGNMGRNIYSGFQNLNNHLRSGYNRAYDYFHPMQGMPAGGYNRLDEPLLNRQAENWRDWGTRMVNDHVRSPLDRAGRTVGGLLGAYGGNRASSMVSNMIPVPSSLTHLAGTMLGAHQGQRAGARAANTMTDYMASGAGMLGHGMDRTIASIPEPVKQMPSQLMQAAQQVNPWSHAANFLSSITPERQQQSPMSQSLLGNDYLPQVRAPSPIPSVPYIPQRQQQYDDEDEFSDAQGTGMGVYTGGYSPPPMMPSQAFRPQMGNGYDDSWRGNGNPLLPDVD